MYKAERPPRCASTCKSGKVDWWWIVFFSLWSDLLLFIILFWLGQLSLVVAFVVFVLVLYLGLLVLHLQVLTLLD